jgi:outer membrane protein
MKMMIKRIMAGMALMTLLTLPALGQGKIGTIDLRNVFDHYWKRQQAEVTLKEEGSALDKELKSFMDDYNKTKEEYGKLMTSSQDQSLSPEERDKRKRDAEAKLMEIKTSENTIRTFEENAKDKVESKKKRMRESILQDIRAAVNAKAKANGYALVIDTSADSFNQTPVVLYSNGENDMTETILAQLNIGAPTPAPDATKPDVKK